jgi:hypothetical protein
MIVPAKRSSVKQYDDQAASQFEGSGDRPADTGLKRQSCESNQENAASSNHYGREHSTPGDDAVTREKELRDATAHPALPEERWVVPVWLQECCARSPHFN